MASSVAEFYNRYLHMWRLLASELPEHVDTVRLCNAIERWQAAPNVITRDAMRTELLRMFAENNVPPPDADTIFSVFDRSWARHNWDAVIKDPMVSFAVTCIAKFPGVPYV
jgi:hypothetical protein